MDAAEPNDAKHDGLSININAPCTNQIVDGDYFEVHVHLVGRDAEEQRVDEFKQEISEDRGVHTPADLRADTLEILIPKAVRIARQIRVQNAGH